MGPVLVVVSDVVDDETFELSLVPDDGAVEQLAPDRSDPTLSEGVGDRCADGCSEDFEALGSEDLVEGIDELAATVTKQSPCTVELDSVSEEQVAGGLGGSGAGGIRRETSEEHLAGHDVDEEQDVIAAQERCVDGEEVTRYSGLGAQEFGPGHLRAVWCGIDAVVLEDLPHGRRSDLVSEADKLAVDASVAPGRVLLREAQDQLAQFDRRWWPARATRPRLVTVQCRAIRRRCQRNNVSGVTIQPWRSGGGVLRRSPRAGSGHRR